MKGKHVISSFLLPSSAISIHSCFNHGPRFPFPSNRTSISQPARDVCQRSALESRPNETPNKWSADMAECSMRCNEGIPNLIMRHQSFSPNAFLNIGNLFFFPFYRRLPYPLGPNSALVTFSLISQARPDICSRNHDTVLSHKPIGRAWPIFLVVDTKFGWKWP